MQRERWIRLEQLFAEALALPIATRSAFLERSCAGDIALRQEIVDLVRSHDAAGVLDAAPALYAADTAAAPRPSLAMGTRLGPWRIEKMIGRGGMGEVYAAMRTDGAFEQRIALKLLRYEASGQLERFHAERRILAKLEHPGIARLLDGGTTPDGRPYTVMEYVEGAPITAYCCKGRQGLRERLELFARVCDAVAYAHSHLVIHRDLKPANILVDPQGEIKLLDFGIAKLLDVVVAERDADTTIAPFTPDYAAPEQLTGQPVSTATDIYALGVLLFELLTGERPLPMQGLPSVHALSLALDRNAPAPSRIARASRAAPLPAHRLTGDLDAIVAKCLRKNPAHRYETINGLKLDIQRHLRNEPVLAREGARLYVFGRLLQRYRWAAAAVFAVVVALAFGLAATLWQAHRAETQSRTSAAVQTFLRDLFRANTSSQDDPVKARQTTARQLLDLGAKKIGTSMNDAPAAKLSILSVLAQLYDDLALDDEAVKLRRESVSLAQTLHGANSAETARTLIELAGSMHASSAVNERLKVLDTAAAVLDHRRDFDSELRAELLARQSEHYQSVDLPRALDYARQSVRLFETWPPSVDLAESLYVRGLIEQNLGLVHESASSLHKAIEVSRTVEGFPNPSLPRFYAFLGQAQQRMQDLAGAETSARLALQTARAVNGENHVDTLQTEMRLGRMLFDTGRTQEGLRLLRAAKERALKIRGPDDPFHTPPALLEYGYGQARAGRLEEGLSDMQAAIANRRIHRPGTIPLANMLDAAASALVDLGHFDGALAYLDEANSIRSNGGAVARTLAYNLNTSTRIHMALAQDNAETAQSSLADYFVDHDETHGFSNTEIERWLLEAEVDLEAGHATLASGLAKRVRIAIEQSGLAAYLDFHAMRADLIEGKAALQNNQPAVALPLLQRTLKVREKLLDPSSPRIAEAQIALAECHLALNEKPQAQALALSAKAIHAQHKDLGDPYRQSLRKLQDDLAAKTKI
ncbi:MAG: serine/threonine-protein kinase [Dokdonella sp.]